MRAEGGRVGLLEHHLDRVAASAEALGMAPMPSRERMRGAVGGGARRLRRPSGQGAPDRDPAAHAAGGGLPRGERRPQTRRRSRRSACAAPGGRGTASPSTRPSPTPGTGSIGGAPRSAGAGLALLLDADGRLGEAALANVIVATGAGRVHGPRPGAAGRGGAGRRGGGQGVRQQELPEAVWREAREIVLTDAVTGALAVVAVDAALVGWESGCARRRSHWPARGIRVAPDWRLSGVRSRAARSARSGRSSPESGSAGQPGPPAGPGAGHLDGALELLPAREVVYRLVEERGWISIADLARELPVIAPRAIHPPYTDDPELYLLRLVAGCLAGARHRRSAECSRPGP